MSDASVTIWMRGLYAGEESDTMRTHICLHLSSKWAWSPVGDDTSPCEKEWTELHHCLICMEFTGSVARSPATTQLFADDTASFARLVVHVLPGILSVSGGWHFLSNTDVFLNKDQKCTLLSVFIAFSFFLFFFTRTCLFGVECCYLPASGHREHMSSPRNNYDGDNWTCEGLR